MAAAAAASVLQTSTRAASIAALALSSGSCQFCAATLVGVRATDFYALAHSAAGEQLRALAAAAPAADVPSPPLPSSPGPSDTCSVCLGIMQEGRVQHDPHCTASRPPAGSADPSPATVSSPIQVAVAAIQARGYDAARFTLGVQLPTSVLVRQHALRAHICTALGLPTLPATMVPVKDAVRARLLSELGSQMPLTPLGAAAAATKAGRATAGHVEDKGLEVPLLTATADGTLPQPLGGLRVQVKFTHAAADAELEGLQSSKNDGLRVVWGGGGGGGGQAKRPRHGTTRDGRCWQAPSHKDLATLLGSLPENESPPYIPGLVPLHMQEGQEHSTPGPAAVYAFTPWRLDTFRGSNGRAGKPTKGGRGKGRTAQALDLRTGKDTVRFPSPPRVPVHPALFQVDVLRTPVFLTGYYNKYQRGVPQSPWGVVDNEEGGDAVDESALPPSKNVASVVGDVLTQHMRAAGVNLSASGREDVDVRMLGVGRPFAVEVEDAGRTLVAPQVLRAWEDAMNANAHGVRISHLSLSSAAGYAAMQSGAEEKAKVYAALVWTSAPLSQEGLTAALSRSQPLELAQRTPLRVMHRRALMTRTRHVLAMQPQWLHPHFFILHLATSAGTYVKEFVHSDLGRTQPSVASLLAGPDSTPPPRCDIMFLDVVDVACPHLQGTVPGPADDQRPAFGQDIPEVTREALALVAAAEAQDLRVHPLKGLMPGTDQPTPCDETTQGAAAQAK